MYQHYWRRYSTLNDPKKHKENPYEFRLLNDSTAYLRLSDFHDYAWLKYNYSTSTEFKSIADILQKKLIKKLIIDLRNNEGGDLGIGMKLMPYITMGTFQPYRYHEVNNYRFPELKAYFTDSTAFPNYPDELFIAQKNGGFRSNPQYKTENWSRPMLPDADNYKNNLYVLINGATGSAASVFATLIRVNRRDAIFIGEEGGGDMEGPVSGSGTDITLPNTKIRVDIPWIKRMVNLDGYKNTKGHGIQPDYDVTPSVKDFTNNVDTELEFAVSLTENKKK
ncbi:MAG TPA: S41 family peptidase [Parafilimonas sp.]|nr:S41 family peptidase [Parafilimonas sp.]